MLIRADDDGFLGAPMRVVRMVGCTETDLNELVNNGYVIKFETGIIVIRDWKVHNSVRKDIYQKTRYQNEFNMLCEIEKRYYLKNDCNVTCDVTGNVTCDVTLNKDKKDKVREVKDSLFTSLTLKEGETLPPSADAGGASTFTLTDCEECAKKNKVNLSEDGITAFYDRMERDGWKIKDSPVTNLLLAMRGFAKNHKRYQKQAEQEEKPKKQILKNFKSWLRYHGYDANYEDGLGDFNEEISIDAEMIDIIWGVDSLSESMYDINIRLTDAGYSMEEIKKTIMLLFNKFSKERENR